MGWKFQEDADIQYCSDGFWNGLDDGSIDPETVLDDPEQIEQLQEAIDLVKSFEEALRDEDLIEE